jgi:hypothetical protein
VEIGVHVEVLVEEASTEAALSFLLPRILPENTTWVVHPHRGKNDLLNKLPSRLRGYSRFLPPDWRLLVLIDEDRQDCRVLKERLNRRARDAGLRLARGSGGEPIQVLNRIAVEELEAWFIGDVDAIRAAYPGVPATLANRAPYRDPDAVAGGTWEALERILKQAGHHGSGLRKVEAARAIAAHMDPARNRSRSFGHFRDGLLRVVGGASNAEAV